MTTYNTTHDGLERVLEGADVVRHSVGPTRDMRVLPMVVLTGMIAAIVVIADRMFSDLFSDGFTREWVALWILCVASVLLLAKSAVKLSAWLLRSEHGMLARWRKARAQAASEHEFRRLAEFDPRMLDDLRAARDRAEASMLGF